MLYTVLRLGYIHGRLVAKNAILIVEFAKDEVEKGNNAVDAVIKAAHLRFRPIGRDNITAIGIDQLSY